MYNTKKWFMKKYLYFSLVRINIIRAILQYKIISPSINLGWMATVVTVKNKVDMT